MVAIYAGVRGYLDGLPRERVTDFEQKFLTEFREKGADVLAAIRDEKDLSSESEEALKAFLESFTKTFV